MATKQHMVPRQLLENFAIPNHPGKPRIYCFDKTNQRIFDAGVRDVGHEEGAYDFTSPSGDVTSIDPILTKWESRYITAIREVLHKPTWETVMQNQGDLAVFVASQMARTEQKRQQFAQGIQQINSHLPAEWDALPDLSSDELKYLQAQMVIGNIWQTIETLLRHSWAIWYNVTDRPFWISDDPVVQDNPHKRNFRTPPIYGPADAGRWELLPSPSIAIKFSPLGTKQPGDLTDPLASVKFIQLYVPLSPRIVLAIYDKNFHEGPPEAEAQHTNVEYINSLQVLQSRRLLFSPDKDFTLAQEMVDENPDLKDPNHYRGPLTIWY